jgi:DNA-binding MarR family transcriptional regulator
MELFENGSLAGGDMPVKPATRVTKPEGVNEELRELLRLVGPVIAALKHGSPPPASFQDAFERGSLGPRHSMPLFTVAMEGTMSVSELADRLGLSLSATSLMVGELSRAGLLERAEDENDRRRTIVRLNEAVRDDTSAWLSERIGPFQRTLARLSPAVRANFIEGWRVLAEETASRDAAC